MLCKQCAIKVKKTAVFKCCNYAHQKRAGIFRKRYTLKLVLCNKKTRQTFLLAKLFILNFLRATLFLPFLRRNHKSIKITEIYLDFKCLMEIKHFVAWWGILFIVAALQKSALKFLINEHFYRIIC
jgi:hypothetical protein